MSPVINNYSAAYGSGRRYELMPSQDVVTRLSLLLNALLVIALFLVASPFWQAVEQIEIEKMQNASLLEDSVVQQQQQAVTSQNLVFHGGHPIAEQTGTCYCGDTDHYCMCTPSVGVDLVITDHTHMHLWVVRRKDTNLLATMGGFANVGESLEQAVRRELTEETGLVLSQIPHKLRLFGVYSDPRRDNRRHSVSAVYVVEVPNDIEPHAADDVKAVEKIKVEEIDQHDFYADHKTILMDFRRSENGEKVSGPLNDGDFADDIMRSICP